MQFALQQGGTASCTASRCDMPQFSSVPSSRLAAAAVTCAPLCCSATQQVQHQQHDCPNMNPATIASASAAAAAAAAQAGLSPRTQPGSATGPHSCQHPVGEGRAAAASAERCLALLKPDFWCAVSSRGFMVHDDVSKVLQAYNACMHRVHHGRP